MDKYLERKGKGLVQVIKSGDMALMLVKQFDPVTGEEMPPQPVQLSVQALQDHIDKLRGDLSDSEAMLEDIQALE